MDKDLQYYMDHPDELPTDPNALAQLANGATVDASDKDEPESPAEDVKPAVAPSGDGEKKAADEPQVKEEEQDILTPSGKGTIPYAVLKSERERRHAAETAVADLTGKLSEIQEQLAKGTHKGDAKAEQLGEEALSAMSSEELDALREDFPAFGSVIDKLMGTIGSLTQQVESLKRSDQDREIAEQRSAARSVQELIDNEPVLLHLQSKEPALFAKAVEIDRALTGDARYPDMASRFAQVAKIMETTFGPFDGVSKPAAHVAPDRPSVDKETVRKAVAEKVASTKATPRSLSDIPAGDMPESDEMARLENLSTVELTDRLLKMTSDQRTAFLNRI